MIYNNNRYKSNEKKKCIWIEITLKKLYFEYNYVSKKIVSIINLLNFENNGKNVDLFPINISGQ